MFMSELLRIPWKRERRHHPRFSSPTLTLVAGPKRFSTLDWSLSGCRIAQPASLLRFHDRVDGTLFIEGENRDGEFLAEVTRRNESGDVGLRWLTLTGSITAAMAEYKPW
jgi:hypothetical protein